MRKLYSTCICIVIALIFQAAGLKAEVNATFTATVCPDSGLPIALLGETSEFWLEDMEIDVTGLPDNEYCIVETEVESISWQVTSNVYGEGAHAYVHSIQPGQNGGNGNTGNHDTLVNYGMYQIQFTGSAMVSWWLADNGGYHLAGQKHAPLQVPPKDFGNVWFMFRNPGEDDPETRPHSSGMVDLNEFTFDDSNPGELRIHLISEIYPDEIRPYFPGNLISYTVDGIAGSDLSYSSIIWYPPYTYHSCYAYFEKLPSSNSAFGRKTARMFYKGGFFEAHDYEVFYPRDAHNHPTCSTCENCPNWFYYWRQAFMQKYPDITLNMRYNDTHEVLQNRCGVTPAMYDWVYDTPQSNNEDRMDKTLILIAPCAFGYSSNLKFNETLTGIDTFFSTIFHELKHVDQISRADMFLWFHNGVLGGTNNNDSFRYGWSWNTSFTKNGRPWQPHNHWAIGLDGKWGKPNSDDDSDSYTDNAAPIPKVSYNIGMLELGQGGNFCDDICLENLSEINSDWPDGWEIYDFSPYNGRDNHNMPLYAFVEREAIKAADDKVRQNDNARLDWGAPGKNHGTLNYFDD